LSVARGYYCPVVLRGNRYASAIGLLSTGCLFITHDTPDRDDDTARRQFKQSKRDGDSPLWVL
jgi:hypothetical protein